MLLFLDLFDKVIDIPQQVEIINRDKETVSAVDLLPKATVELGLRFNREVNFLGKVVHGVDENCLGRVDFVDEGSLCEDCVEVGVDLSDVLADLDSFVTL